MGADGESSSGSNAESDERRELRAAYQVTISSLEREVLDGMLLEALDERRATIDRELTMRAARRFGPAYFVEVQGGQPDRSIRTLALLSVYYPVRAAAGLADELRHFAGEVEVAIAEALGTRLESPLMVAAELDEASVAEAPDSGEEQTAGWDRIAPVLGAIATGIGVLGFVTFVGGAIEWARFHATGLPQEEALSVVPTSSLVVVGASTLVPAVIYGALASVLYLIAAIFFGRREQRIPDPADRTAVERHGEAVRALALFALVVAFEFLAFFETLEAPGTAQYVAFFLLGLLMASLTYSVARVTERLLWLGPTVFLALSIFLGGVDYVRARSTPELRGAALVRNNEKAVIGFFIAENGSRVYLARLDAEPLRRNQIDRSSARLIGIQKEQVTDIEIGSPSSPQDAFEQARDLAEELCGLEIPKRPPKSGSLQDCWTEPPGE